jgi:hypothetical protein
MVWTFLGCLGLALLFPKGFKYLIGTIVGMFFGGFAWGLFAMLATPHSFHGAGQTFVLFLIIGAIVGNVFAAKG